jgi:hypothetical protein
MAASYTKVPVARLDYTWDWTPWLADVSDTISDATVTVPEGLTAVGERVVDGGFVTQRVEGGVLDDVYKMVCVRWRHAHRQTEAAFPDVSARAGRPVYRLRASHAAVRVRGLPTVRRVPGTGAGTADEEVARPVLSVAGATVGPIKASGASGFR